MAIGGGFKVRLLKQKKPLLQQLTFRVYQNDFFPDDESVTGDFVEATYPGYAPLKPLCWLRPYLTDEGFAVLPACYVTLTMTGVAPTNALYGWFMTDENGFFALGQRFPRTPVTFDRIGSTFRYQVLLAEDSIP